MLREDYLKLNIGDIVQPIGMCKDNNLCKVVDLLTDEYGYLNNIVLVQSIVGNFQDCVYHDSKGMKVNDNTRGYRYQALKLIRKGTQPNQGFSFFQNAKEVIKMSATNKKCHQKECKCATCEYLCSRCFVSDKKCDSGVKDCKYYRKEKNYEMSRS